MKGAAVTAHSVCIIIKSTFSTGNQDSTIGNQDSSIGNQDSSLKTDRVWEIAAVHLCLDNTWLPK